MSRSRTFTKAEMMDAARAAAENGLRVILHKTGEIEFSNRPIGRETVPTPESALEGWLNGREAGGRA
jgi:hypothetical protein